MKQRLLTSIIILASAMVYAQGPPPPPPPGLSIDGGIFVLALAGLYYGIKKLRS